MKRILTIQDISCVGRCSLTVALPILSAMGHETSILPTAVLSAHTLFSDVTFRDLTDDLPGIAEHWKKEDIRFDAIYTGYLGSERQIQIVKDFFSAFGDNHPMKIIDPVMGDHGKLYSGFDEAFASEMAGLCALADVIVPNLTEAAFLLKRPCLPDFYTEQQIRDLLKALSELGSRQVALTGVSFTENEVGIMSYDTDTDQYDCYFTEKMPVSYHGTGDCFASCLSGALLRGEPMQQAIQTAADFIVTCLRCTPDDPAQKRFGVHFEMALPSLMQKPL